jgi:gliding motility-associated-like protein
MKKTALFVFILFCSLQSFAGHIAGGEIYYKYLGAGAAANTSRYLITLRLFRECNPPTVPGQQVATLPSSVEIAIYNNSSPSTQYGGLVTAPIKGGNYQTLPMTGQNPCITSPVAICYQLGSYEFTQDLPNTAAGYIVMYQTCCRTNTILNVAKQPLPSGTTGEGATYTCEIPGTNLLNASSHNSSAVFAIKDTTLVCNGYPFKLDFSATDPDGDSLSYSFCGAYDRGNTSSAADINYSSPPFNEVTYTSGFSGMQPLGAGASINPVTGIISGTAPTISSYYVVNVCITEWRNGKPISFHRKDFTLRVTDCTVTAAQLNPTYITCNGTTLNFQNESVSSNIVSYHWDFGVSTLTTDTSNNPTPTYDYLQSGKDSGTYTVKLKVASASGCEDSATAQVLVYPGFKTDFTVLGTCFYNAYAFNDATVSKYGTVSSWRWNFGDSTTLADTARTKDSVWKYSSARTVQVNLITANNKGCIDTASKSITILDKPQLNLPFRDTLICSIDTLALRVLVPGTATVLWTPRTGPNFTRILNQTSATPLVFPRDTTKYYVSINDNGCTNSDSVTVNVLQYVTVSLQDTGICRTDTMRLHPVTDALSFRWTSSTGEKVDGIKNPLVRPLSDTRYSLTANLGKCQAVASMLTTVNPYPASAAGSDINICFGSRVQLNGTVTGTAFSWSPTNSLVNQNTLTPTAAPTRTTAYLLTATNVTGCLKSVTDTVLVTVIQPIAADAGRDTAIAVGQPLQLQASGGTGYLWRPVIGLSDPTISNPIALLDNSIDSIIYTVRVTEGPCYADDQVKVRVYKKGADIFVPSAFTPNADGKNDLVHATPIGIQKFNYFSIYNRWGQMVFSTNDASRGWDGTFNGLAQPSGTYVYQAQGLDFKGSSIFRKGTLVLIR